MLWYRYSSMFRIPVTNICNDVSGAIRRSETDSNGTECIPISLILWEAYDLVSIGVFCAVVEEGITRMHSSSNPEIAFYSTREYIMSCLLQLCYKDDFNYEGKEGILHIGFGRNCMGRNNVYLLSAGIQYSL